MQVVVVKYMCAILLLLLYVLKERLCYICVASSGIASLWLSGGHIAHSQFKVPIPMNEVSTCNIKKGDPWYKLLYHTSLIIWDEVPMQHQNCIECVDHSLQDL